MVAADGSIKRSARKRGLYSTSSSIGCRPMCSTPPARITSAAPIAISPAPVVIAVNAPAHIRSTAKPGIVRGRPASKAMSRPSVSPWSPTCAVAAKATSSIRSGGSESLRRRSAGRSLAVPKQGTGADARKTWQAHVDREDVRYRDGESRLPDIADADSRQRQLTRLGNAAAGAGLALLMAGRREEAATWLVRAAE